MRTRSIYVHLCQPQNSLLKLQHLGFEIYKKHLWVNALSRFICVWFRVQVCATLMKDLHPPTTSHKFLSKVLFF